MTRWTEEQLADYQARREEPQQLDLLKGKRQRGRKPPPPLEFHLHVLIADTLVRWASHDWRWTHLPMGEFRTVATAGRLKRMGVTAGWPDFMFFSIHGRVCFLELKRRGRHETEAQEEKEKFLRRAGHDYLCTSSFDEALNWLKRLGVVPSKITTWATGTTNTHSGEAASCEATGESAIE